MNKSAQILLYRIILGCPLLLVAPEHALAAPSDPDWKEFQIPDLGTRVDYPAAVFSVSDGKSEVGMGERLSTADRRASLTIYSRANETGETPASYLRKNLRLSQSVIQYQRVTPTFFAISAEREGTIYYSRCNFQRAARPEHSLLRSDLSAAGKAGMGRDCHPHQPVTAAFATMSR